MPTNPQTFLESTTVGMNEWWYRNFQFHRNKQTFTGERLRSLPTVVTWIDDRNKAAALGVTVEELLASRAVAAALDPPPSNGGQVLADFQLTVPAPRYHGQIKGFK